MQIFDLNYLKQKQTKKKERIDRSMDVNIAAIDVTTR